MDAQPNATPNQSNAPAIRIQLPWTFILSSFGALAVLLIVMWAGLNRLSEKVGDLEATVRAGNTLMATLQSDVNQLKFRQDISEKTVQRILEDNRK